MNSRWGCFGLSSGAVAGLLLAIALATFLRPVPAPARIQPATISPDITLFVSEQSLSRFASKTVERPTIVDFDLNGQMHITTQVDVGGLKPVVHAGLLLEMQGTDITSRLRWIRLGFLTIPASWVPAGFIDMVAVAGQAIQSQIPPDFSLIRLGTNQDGINFQLKWVGE